MAELCNLCRDLSIRDLIELSKPVFSNLLPHNSRYYHHHKCFSDLEASAQQGCDLCQLIVDGFKSTSYPALGEGVTLYSALQLLPDDTTNVKFTIHTSHMRNAPQKVDDVQVFDTLMVHVGPGPDDRSVLDFDELHEWRLELILTLTTPRGMFCCTVLLDLLSRRLLTNCFKTHLHTSINIASAGSPSTET